MRRFTALAASALALSLSLTACSSDSSSTDGSNSPDKLTLALIPNEKVNDLVTTAKPLTDYLSEELGIEVEGVVTKDYQAAVEAIGSGQADIAIASAAQLASAEDMYGAHTVLQDERFGADSYAGQFVTNNPDKYCEDEPVASTYAASGADYLYCNGTATPEVRRASRRSRRSMGRPPSPCWVLPPPPDTSCRSWPWNPRASTSTASKRCQ